MGHIRRSASLRALIRGAIGVLALLLPPSLPVLAVAEYDIPPCRWPHTTGTNTYITYQFGSNLQVPGSQWRNAFENATSEWNAAGVTMKYFSGGGQQTFNTYDDPYGDDGYSQPYCSGSATSRYESYGNVGRSQADYQAYAIASHEAGHGFSLGHINDSRIALMGYNPNQTSTPQDPDRELVRQVYP